MLAPLALIHKELKLLYRDKAGLFLLFIMPMAFVFIITLLQANHTKNLNKIPILLINYDQGEIGKLLQQQVQHHKQFSFIQLKPNQSSEQKAKKEIASGQYKILIIIPKNTSTYLTQKAKTTAVGQLQANKIPQQDMIQLWLDPATPAIIKQTVLGEIKMILQQYRIQSISEILSNVLGTPSVNYNQQAFPIKTYYANTKNRLIQPNPVQQNIPAWALFGMFFIVIPLSSIIIKERDQGINIRLRLAPISQTTLISTRIIAFLLINLLQLFLMLMVGIAVMPYLGLPGLTISGHFILVLCIGICAALAATSFGLLIGSIAKTIEQAAAVGPILVVIAAAIGGIMVPTYLMPPTMQTLSAYSPLQWGQSAFINALVRDAGFMTIFPELLKLILFSMGALFISLLITKNRR